MEKHRKISHKRFEECLLKLGQGLKKYLNDNDLKVDYICPILRSGAIPAVYIANHLNLIKFAPIQVKHIEFKDGSHGYAKLFMPFSALEIEKDNPVFLIVDGNQGSGESVKLCINEFIKAYPNSKILYVCIAKRYGTQSFKDLTIYEDHIFYYNGINNYSKKKCQELGIDYYVPLYPWEILDQERNHTDDLEDNIYY